MADDGGFARAVADLDAAYPAAARAVLRQGKATLEIEILAPAEARFAVAPATRPAPENANAGISRLHVDLATDGRPLRLTLAFRPASTPTATRVEARALEPLDRWLEP